MILLQLLLISSLLNSGLGASILGSIKVPLAERLRIDEGRVGGLVSLFGFTLIPSIFAAGFLTDLAGRRLVMVSGSLLIAVSFVVLARGRQYIAALVGTVLLAAGWALIVNVNNVLTPEAFPGGMAYATNLANVFFGLGAFFTPLAVALLLRRLALGATLVILAGFAALPALLALGVDLSAATPAAEALVAGKATFGQVLGDPVLWLCGLALFFYSPLEASLAAWATTYLGEQGHRPAVSSALLSAFWLSFMAARLLTAFSLSPGGEEALLLTLSLAGTAVLVAMVVARGRFLSAALLPLAGAIFGPIFPTMLAVLLGHFAPSLHGRACGLLFAIGGVGWSLIPMLIGSAAKRWGIRRAFGVAVVAALGLSATATALLFR